MNKNISEVQIEIGEKEYTLFMNRTGLVTWEKHTKLQEKAEKYKETYIDTKKDKDIVIDENTNPFEMYSDINVDNDIDTVRDMYAEFYWIALYTHHKLNFDQARELFVQAEKEYGLKQLIALARQMIEDMNTDQTEGELKNLKALRPEAR